MLFPWVLLIVLVSCSDEKFGAVPPKRVGNVAIKPLAEAVSTPQNQPAAEALAPEKLFNVAILTKGVQCLFCHMKIEGDVGGIQFPSNEVMHERSGEALRILGSLYGTNTVPAKLSDTKITSSVVSNYTNSELKIFPTTKDSAGGVVFPAVGKELFEGKTKGSVKLGTLELQNTFSGDLVLVAKQGVLEVDGEVFIDGDVILGGTYKGTGTIYAKNIFIVRDLVAANSPYPYPSDPSGAKAKAKEDIAAQKDGLYLFALGQITVGYPDPVFYSDRDRWRVANPLSRDITRDQPHLSLDSYKNLAQPKVCALTEGKSKDYGAVLVNQVDAFLYASDYLLWRTCGGFILNGGFVTPYVALVNAGDAVDTEENRNKEPTNLVRYDYRLRAGVKAYSLLKELFEQE